MLLEVTNYTCRIYATGISHFVKPRYITDKNETYICGETLSIQEPEQSCMICL